MNKQENSTNKIEIKEVEELSLKQSIMNLAKMSMSETGFRSSDYVNLNKSVKSQYLKYCAKKSELKFDIINKESITRAFSNPTFEWEYFSILTEVLNTLCDIREDEMSTNKPYNISFNVMQIIEDEYDFGEDLAKVVTLFNSENYRFININKYYKNDFYIISLEY